MILMADVTGYKVGRHRFTREEHGAMAYRAAWRHVQAHGGRIVATGVRSQRDATGRWQAAS